MNSVQESKNELDAAIRYAENAISSAKQTIESMTFRQEMAQKNFQEQTGREKALQNQVGELKSECAVLAERIDEMKDAAFAEAKTIEYLKSERSKMQDCIKLRENQIAELESKVQGQYDDIVMLEREVEFYTKKYNELELSQGKGEAERKTIEQLERDVTVKTAQAEAWKKEADKLRHKVCEKFEPTMPVIPKDVAIAIFREGTLFGVEAACDEIQGETINISENNYVGDFSVSFERDIDLDDFIDFDWVRGKIGDYDEDSVTANLEGLCAKNNFECRIHGIDKQEEKKND